MTLCGIICNNNAMLSPGFLRYDPSKSNFRLLVTIVASVLFAFLQTNPLKSRQSPSCLCGTAEAPLGMPEATPTTHEAVRGRIQTYFFRLPTLCDYDPISFLPKGSFLPFPSCARASLPRGLGHPCRRAAATTACDLPMQSVTPAWLATTSCGLRLRCSRNSSGHAPALLREGCRRELLRRTRTFPSIHNASAH